MLSDFDIEVNPNTDGKDLVDEIQINKFGSIDEDIDEQNIQKAEELNIIELIDKKREKGKKYLSDIVDCAEEDREDEIITSDDRKRTRALVEDLYQDGLGINQIAQQVNLSKRQIRATIKSMKAGYYKRKYSDKYTDQEDACANKSISTLIGEV